MLIALATDGTFKEYLCPLKELNYKEGFPWPLFLSLSAFFFTLCKHL